MTFPKNTASKRRRTMLKVDGRRMFTMPLVYIMVAACLVMPILILTMTSMMDGMVTVDPQTGVETVIEGFDNTWQIIGSVSNAEQTAAMSMMSMCNINLLYFFVAVLVCLFVAGDFRSGYCKNLFTVRASKGDYVLSKTLICFLGGALMILAFFAGTFIGGAVAGLPYTMDGFNSMNLLMCLLAKMALMAVFVPIYLCMAVIAKARSWMSILLSMMVGMFMFMMIPLLTPLDANPVHVIGCLAGGVLFGVGLGMVDAKLLNKKDLI